MNKILIFCLFIILISCENYSKLTLINNLPKTLEEVSGIEKYNNTALLWMLNDGGNKPFIYKVDKKGDIVNKVAVNAKNNDWEDITSDKEGKLYIADFGNNNNKRKKLRILKIKYQDLLVKNLVEVTTIKFGYSAQKKFPPKKKNRFFDAEGLVYKNGFLYIFTKSRVKGNYGVTSFSYTC
ncbi:hypothetical protein [Tenacibaculum aestuariivivum]|uniref:hypothetical protein n=1 Tax=Tenacibaculum aestuariivivum TaxID=2006131 RepID=UPI003AB57E66